MFREQNKEANDLAQIVSGYKLSKQNFEALIIVKEKLQDEIEILNINLMVNHDQSKPLTNYLQNANLFVDRKTKYKVVNYVILGYELYKRSMNGLLLKCLRESETYIALAKTYDEICGSQQASER